MTAVGIYEAKAHFSELVNRAARGERIVITRHGRPCVDLVPSSLAGRGSIEDVLADAREFRKGRVASADDLRRWVDEGRR